MSEYVLVHGAWHGKWCWDKVVQELERQGHQATAVDLPGHGSDRTPVAQVTLEAYVARVCEALRNAAQPVFLVGHSMGGGVITRSAELEPERVRKLIYVAGILPRDGQNMAEILSWDQNSLIVKNQLLSEDKLSVTVREEALADIFYSDCSADDISRAKSLLVPQSIAPVIAPIHVTPERFGRIPRLYIATLQDRAIIPALQSRMYSATPCEQVIPLDTSHSPFFSSATALADHLGSL